MCHPVSLQTHLLSPEPVSYKLHYTKHIFSASNMVNESRLLVSAFDSTESSSGDLPESINASSGTVDMRFSVLVVIPAVIQLIFCVIVLRVFYKLPNLRTSANFPVINLIASDFVRAVVGFLAVSLYSGSQSGEDYRISRTDTILCKVFLYCSSVQFAWSSWAIAILSYSRSDAIVNVLSPTFSTKRFWTLSVISWIGSILTALPPFLGWSSYGYTIVEKKTHHVCGIGGGGRNGILHALFLPLFYFIHFLVPTFLVILHFSRIVRAVQHRGASNGPSNVIVLAHFSSPTDQSRQPSTASQIKAVVKSKAFLYIVIIIISNVILSLPFVCVQSYKAVISELRLHHKQVPNVPIQVTSILLMANFNVNSLLYIFWIKTFQHAAAAMCPCHRH